MTENRRLRSRGLLLCLMAWAVSLLFAKALLSAEAAFAVLQPGDAAPPFALKDTQGRTIRLDTSSATPVLLVFVKPGDRYTSEALGAMNEMFQKWPELSQGLDRLIVCSRLAGSDDARKIKSMAGSQWPVLLDTENRIGEKYRIIATPTVVLVGRDRYVKAVNPGYDLNMESFLHGAIAEVLGLPPPKEIPAELPKAAMSIQMARRMASRGQYDRALYHYSQAAKEGKLTPETEIEMAGAEIEVGRFQDAEEILKRWQDNPLYAKSVAETQKRMETLKMSKGVPVAAPKVTR